MNDVALFESALRAAVPTRPDPRLGTALVPRLAEVARAATIEAETQTTRRRTAAPRSRFALVARVGIAVALIPLVLAGLAVAGVTVPGPARSAFDSVGITLPNQPAKHAKATSPGQASPPAEDTVSAADRHAETAPRATRQPRTSTLGSSTARLRARPRGTRRARRSASTARRLPDRQRRSRPAHPPTRTRGATRHRTPPPPRHPDRRPTPRPATPTGTRSRHQPEALVLEQGVAVRAALVGELRDRGHALIVVRLDLVEAALDARRRA